MIEAIAEDDRKYDQTFAVGQRVVLGELLPGDESPEDPWAMRVVSPGAPGVVQRISDYGPPEYFVRFTCGPLTVRGWYYAHQLHPMPVL